MREWLAREINSGAWIADLGVLAVVLVWVTVTVWLLLCGGR